MKTQPSSSGVGEAGVTQTLSLSAICGRSPSGLRRPQSQEEHEASTHDLVHRTPRRGRVQWWRKRGPAHGCLREDNPCFGTPFGGQKLGVVLPGAVYSGSMVQSGASLHDILGPSEKKRKRKRKKEREKTLTKNYPGLRRRPQRDPIATATQLHARPAHPRRATPGRRCTGADCGADCSARALRK